MQPKEKEQGHHLSSMGFGAGKSGSSPSCAPFKMFDQFSLHLNLLFFKVAVIVPLLRGVVNTEFDFV